MNVPDPLWKAYRQELSRFIVSRVRDADVAEDLVHEVLIRAYSHREQLNDIGRIRPWLYRITRNVIIDYYRATRPTDEVPEDLAADAPDEVEAATREIAACLRPLIRQLPESYGNALSLADLEDIPQAQVAELLGLSLSGAKSRIQRARAMLKDAVLECCWIELDHRGRFTSYEQRADSSGCGGRTEQSRTGIPGEAPNLEGMAP